jgi:hypothetical protein
LGYPGSRTALCIGAEGGGTVGIEINRLSGKCLTAQEVRSWAVLY